jgi:hypothetical protein
MTDSTGSIPCDNCGAEWDEPCSADCAPQLREWEARRTVRSGPHLVFATAVVLWFLGAIGSLIWTLKGWF